MSAIALLSVVPIILWMVQSVLLRAAGLPLRWRIDSRNAPPHVRAVGRMTTQVCLVGVMCLYPLIRGRLITEYYAALLPGRAAIDLVHGIAASMLCLCLLFLAWIATGRLQVLLHHSRRKCIRRLVLLLPTACIGALVEELLFRGIVVADLLAGASNAVPAGARILSRTDLLAIVALSALIFAVAHYVRAVKRRWTFFGHVALGCLLGLAFLQTRTLWLPIGLHAGGILMIMGTRPFFRYRGPAWLIGASIFPFAGAAGIAGLVVLTTYVLRYNPTP